MKFALPQIKVIATRKTAWENYSSASSALKGFTPTIDKICLVFVLSCTEYFFCVCVRNFGGKFLVAESYSDAFRVVINSSNILRPCLIVWNAVTKEVPC